MFAFFIIILIRYNKKLVITLKIINYINYTNYIYAKFFIILHKAKH